MKTLRLKLIPYFALFYLTALGLGMLIPRSPLMAQENGLADEDCKQVSLPIDLREKETWIGNIKKLFKRNPHRPIPVKFSEVKSWIPLGHRYAAGYDENHQLLSVVDLAYPSIFSKNFFPRTLLGAIGVGDFNMQNVSGPVLSAIQRKVERKKVKAIDRFFRKENPQLKISGEAFPPKFTMADLDLEKMSGKSLNRFHSLMKKAGIKDNFLSRIQFERNDKGEYDVYFLGTETVDDDHPPKLIDFRAYKSSYKRAGLITMAMVALKSVVGVIPLPPFKNILAALVERWLMLYETQLVGHLGQVLQLLDDAYHGDPDSPFAKLSKEDQEKALRYVHNANTMFSNLLPKLILGRKRPWERKEKLYEEKKKKALEWLQKNDIEVTLLHPYFALAKDGDGESRKLFVLPHSRLFQKRPITAINYKHPQYELIKRTLKEQVQQGMNYLDLVIPIPVVPSVIQILNNAFINDEVMRRKIWEARLSSWMLNQQDIHHHQDWEKELKLLYQRRLNPFELSREEEELLIRKRKEMLGIKDGIDSPVTAGSGPVSEQPSIGSE